MSADEAEARWNEGHRYYPDPHMQISRSLLALIDQCNFEASAADAGQTLH